MLSKTALTEAIGALGDFMLVFGGMERQLMVVVGDENVYPGGSRMSLNKLCRRTGSHIGLLRTFR